METSLSANFIKKSTSRLKSSKQNKKIRRFYIQFFENLTRKTEAEKRIEIFGKDPFKDDKNHISDI